jgi:hypothetical protein
MVTAASSCSTGACSNGCWLATRGALQELFVGDSNDVLVRIPPMVWISRLDPSGWSLRHG